MYCVDKLHKFQENTRKTLTYNTQFVFCRYFSFIVFFFLDTTSDQRKPQSTKQQIYLIYISFILKDRSWLIRLQKKVVVSIFDMMKYKKRFLNAVFHTYTHTRLECETWHEEDMQLSDIL